MAETGKQSNDFESAKKCEEQGSDPGLSAGMETSRVGECLLLEDDVLPVHAARLVTWIRCQRQPPDGDMDVLFGLLMVLAVETGFRPLGSEDPYPATAPGLSACNLRCISRMPRGWRRSGQAGAGPRYLIHMDLGAEGEVRLVGVDCGDVLIANMLTAGEVGFSHGFAPREYLSAGGRPHNLRALSHRFKDRVAVPVRAATLNERGLCNPSLVGLPGELHLQLGVQLQAQDLFHLGLTCRGLSHLLADQTLWRALLKRRYPAAFILLRTMDEGAAGSPVDWRQEFRKRKAQDNHLRGAFFRPAFFRPEFMM